MAPVALSMNVSSDEPGTRDPAVTLAETMRRAVAARDAGFGTITVAHRYSVGPSAGHAGETRTPLYTWRFQPLLMLAHIAAELRDTVKYSTSVLVSTGLHPVQLAEEAATLDAMCHGGLRLGVGLGWMPYEFEAFGVDMKTRARRLEELLVAYRALFTQPDVTLGGPVFPMTHRSMVAKSVQRPMPPLWVGASADAAVRRAARVGDAWVASAHIDLATLRRQQDIFREERARSGLPQPADMPVGRLLVIAEDRETALKQVRPVVEDWYRKRGEWGWFLTEAPETDVAGLGERWLVGDPDDCVRQIAAIRKTLGATDIICTMAYPGATQEDRLRMIDLMGRYVIPEVKRWA